MIIIVGIIICAAIKKSWFRRIQNVERFRVAVELQENTVLVETKDHDFQVTD